MTVSTSVCVFASVLALIDAFALNDELLRGGEGFFPFEPPELLDRYFSFLSSLRLPVSALMESDGTEPMLLLLSVSTGTTVHSIITYRLGSPWGMWERPGDEARCPHQRARRGCFILCI